VNVGLTSHIVLYSTVIMMVFQLGFRNYGVLWPIESVGWEVYAYPRASTFYQDLVSSSLANNTVSIDMNI